MQARDEDHVKMTAALESWLAKVGAPSDIAVDLADVGFAGRRVDAIVRKMVALDPAESASRELAADLVAELRSWLFAEIGHHIRELEQQWNELESAIEPEGE